MPRSYASAHSLLLPVYLSLTVPSINIHNRLISSPSSHAYRGLLPEGGSNQFVFIIERDCRTASLPVPYDCACGGAAEFFFFAAAPVRGGGSIPGALRPPPGPLAASPASMAITCDFSSFSSASLMESPASFSSAALISALLIRLPSSGISAISMSVSSVRCSSRQERRRGDGLIVVAAWSGGIP